MSYRLNVPTALTLARLIISPIILPFLIVYLLPYNIFWINMSLAAVCGLLCLTDILDGFIARAYSQETMWGKMLDPIADKFLLYSVLVALLAIGKIYFLWVIILVGREFFIMGLRHIALEQHMFIEVSWLAKAKTMVTMMFLPVVIANPYHGLSFCTAPWWNGLEYSLLAASVWLSVWSAYQYYDQFVHRLKAE